MFLLRQSGILFLHTSVLLIISLHSSAILNHTFSSQLSLPSHPAPAPPICSLRHWRSINLVVCMYVCMYVWLCMFVSCSVILGRTLRGHPRLRRSFLGYFLLLHVYVIVSCLLGWIWFTVNVVGLQHLWDQLWFTFTLFSSFCWMSVVVIYKLLRFE